MMLTMMMPMMTKRKKKNSSEWTNDATLANTRMVKAARERKKKQDEERKRAQEKQFVEDRRRAEMEHKEIEAKRLEQQQELKRQEMRAEQERDKEARFRDLRTAGAKDIGKRRHNWDITISSPVASPSISAPPDTMQTQMKAKLSKPKPLPDVHMPPKKYKPIKTDGGAPKKKEAKKANTAVSLKVKDGLPVSLSVGQKGVKALFIGKNASEKRLTIEFSVSIEDSKEKTIEPKLEPKQCLIEPDTELPFSLEFDGKEDTETGPLTLSAQLRENGFYVDRESAKSEPIILTSQVKTPMQLEYIPGSAEFEKQAGGALALALVFENTGETGGFLLARSSAGYGTEMRMKRSNLAKKTKIKGKQKKVRLVFSPAEETAIEFLAFDFSGTDANGKEYLLRNSFDVKSGKMKRETRAGAEKEGKKEGAKAGAAKGNGQEGKKDAPEGKGGA